MAKQLKQHEVSNITEHSERKGTSTLRPADRTKARSVKVTSPALTLDSAKNSTERAEQTRRANGHTHSEGVGLKAASASSNNRNAEGVKSTDLGWAGNEADCK
jgi:hypothetical protein